jgi:hypothetical protein
LTPLVTHVVQTDRQMGLVTQTTDNRWVVSKL